MTQGSANALKKLLHQANEFREKSQKSLVVFDLDSTLFDVSPRLEQILHDFANLQSTLEKFPESAQILANAKTLPQDWGIRQALIRLDLHLHSEDFLRAVHKFWLESFFTNHYLQYDRIYPGAPEFVRRLYELGSEIVYLSGRDVRDMSAGTIEALHKFGFPIECERAQLVLKPIKGSDDAEFKKNWFLKVPPDQFQKIWFFENEPVNVSAIEKHLPHMEVW